MGDSERANAMTLVMKKQSSRICVKNLPRYVTDEKLREHFAAKGEVTDAKIIRTRDGRTRQFGFVGFRTEDEAQDAVKYFHRSFFDTSRLSCELAHAIGDPNLPRPWSRHSRGSSAFDKTQIATDKEPSTLVKAKKGAGIDQDEISKGAKAFDDIKNDPQLLEFLEVMQPRSKTKLWANDSTVALGIRGDRSEKGSKLNRGNGKEQPPQLEVKTVDGVLKWVPVGKDKGAEKYVHVRFEGEIDTDDSDDGALYEEAPLLDKEAEGTKRVEESLSLEIGGKGRMISGEKDPVVKDERVSDLEYMKSRMRGGDWSSDEEEKGCDERNKPVFTDVTLEKISDEAGTSSAKEDETEFGEMDMTDASSMAVMPARENGYEDDREEREESRGRINGAGEGEESLDQIVAEEQESVSETGRLFVRNLPYTASEEELAEIFGRFGELSQVHLVLDKMTKRSKGLAYILFMLPEAAVRAMEDLDKSIFQGRLLHILPAKRPPPAPEPKEAAGRGPGSTKYKQDREAQRKSAEASGNIKAWNPLFMRPDTIAENVARQYGMSKSEFLDPEAEDLAVRMALGETDVIAQTKRSLSNEGINVDVLEEVASGKTKTVKRSNCVMLVKNLPFTTSEGELVSMFGAFGSLGRVVLPQTKTLALVEYLEAAEARCAFKSLAYKRFKNVPLYLEWAPESLLTVDGRQRFTKGAQGAMRENEVKRAVMEQQLAGVPDDNDDAAQAQSLFVKNLSFSTTEPSLKKHFQQHITQGTVRSVTIKKASKSGRPLSMGFGFVEFDSSGAAKMVCQQLQGTVLDGHALVLQLSHHAKKSAGRNSKGKLDKKESSTKIIVRNVAFEATKKDLQQLFSPFGQIKSVRLPKKFDGHHRGFAFVEFITRQEARNAFDALQSTHLYGRHLVLERVKEGETLEELQTRTATRFFEESGINMDSGRPTKMRKHSSLDGTTVTFGQFAD